jgi:hypothetical protein
MPHLAAHAPERFTNLIGELAGREWTPPSAPKWPVHFTRTAADLVLTVYPDRLNNRIVFLTASLTAPERRRHAQYTPDLSGNPTIDTWLAGGDLDAAADALGAVVRHLIAQPLPEPGSHQLEELATRAQELGIAAKVATSLVCGEPVADAANRVDHMRTLAPARTTGAL